MPQVSDAKQSRSYEYYDNVGQLLGQTQGEHPTFDLFSRAHYVVANQQDMLKNLDPEPVLQKFIAQYRKELINTPMTNMSAIMDLNLLIRNLEKFLPKTKSAKDLN